MTEPRWRLHEEKAALIVVDMQNGFLREDGFFAKGGLDWRRCAATIEPNRRALAAARAAGLPVVFTRYTLKADYSDAGLLAQWRPRLKSVGAMVRGTRDWEICEELQPLPGELIVDKTRYSAFHETGLAETLRARGVSLVVVTGVTTNMCVEFDRARRLHARFQGRRARGLRRRSGGAHAAGFAYELPLRLRRRPGEPRLDRADLEARRRDRRKVTAKPGA